MKTVNEGPFISSEVYRYEERNKVYALKLFGESDYFELGGSAVREISLLRMMRHPTVMSSYGLLKAEDGRIGVLLPFADAGDAGGYAGKLSPDELTVISYDTICGLSYLHAYHIIHGDVKPQNIMLYRKDDGTLSAKIGDLGSTYPLSTIVRPGQMSEVCTNQYRPPEVLFYLPFDTKADIWAYGVTIYQLATDKLPFNGSGDKISGETSLLLSILGRLGKPSSMIEEDYLRKIDEWDYLKPVGEILNGLKRTTVEFVDDKLLNHLLRSIFTYDPVERPTATQLATEPFFDDVRDNSLIVEPFNKKYLIDKYIDYPADWSDIQGDITHEVEKIFFPWVLKLARLFKHPIRTVVVAIKLLDQHLATEKVIKSELMAWTLAAYSVVVIAYDIDSILVADYIDLLQGSISGDRFREMQIVLLNYDTITTVAYDLPSEDKYHTLFISLTKLRFELSPYDIANMTVDDKLRSENKKLLKEIKFWAGSRWLDR